MYTQDIKDKQKEISFTSTQVSQNILNNILYKNAFLNIVM